MEGEVLNVKAKAMTVEKVVEKKEHTDLQDLKQQIVINHNYEKCYDGKCKIKRRGRDFIPKEERNVLKFS